MTETETETIRYTADIVTLTQWWETCDSLDIKGNAIVAARMALKHADGAVPAAVPLRQEDVDATV